MKLNLTLLTALLVTSLLSACDKKEEPVVAPAPVANPAPVAPPPAKVEPGGYEPTAEERVPGITLTQAEIDAKFAEARAATPQPIIPGEAVESSTVNPAEETKASE